MQFTPHQQPNGKGRPSRASRLNKLEPLIQSPEIFLEAIVTGDREILELHGLRCKDITPDLLIQAYGFLSLRKVD